MNWENVDLSDGYERDQNFLDPYSFDTLLLEISCNIPNDKISRESVLKQVHENIQNRVEEAYRIIENNLDNIVEQARKEKEL